MAAAPMAHAIVTRSWRAAAVAGRYAHVVLDLDDDGNDRRVALCGTVLGHELVPEGERRRCRLCVRAAAKGAQAVEDRARVVRKARAAEHWQACKLPPTANIYHLRPLRDQAARAARAGGGNEQQIDDLVSVARGCALGEALEELRAVRGSLPDESGLDYVTAAAIAAARGALEMAERRVAAIARRTGG